MKTTIADGSLRCGHYSISRMLKEEAIVVGETVVVWRSIARRCRAVISMDLSKSWSSGDITGM
jgi:hypothetical protein